MERNKDILKLLGTHNSMSYMKPKSWWMYPINFIAKCQSKTIDQQLNSGIEVFDLRIRFDKHGIPYFAHGLVAYKGEDSVKDILNILQNQGLMDGPKYVRIILETNKPDMRQDCLFQNLVSSYISRYDKIIFYEFKRKCNWYELIPNSIYISNEQYVSSMKKPWIFIPYIYAKLFNRKNFRKYLNSNPNFNTAYLFDFI